jgi:hypothetical protein
MPSNITAIREAIAASYASVPELDFVAPYLPPAINATCAHVFWISGWEILHATLSGMRIGWTLTGYICLVPTDEAETERRLAQLVADMTEALFTNLHASGTIEDGTIQFSGGERVTLTVAGVPFASQLVTYFLEESFPFAYS